MHCCHNEARNSMPSSIARSGRRDLCATADRGRSNQRKMEQLRPEITQCVHRNNVKRYRGHKGSSCPALAFDVCDVDETVLS